MQQGIRVAQALNLASFASQFSSTGIEDPAWDIGLDIEADDPKNLLSIWGVQAELSKEIKVGMSLQTRFNVRSEGVAKTTLGDDIPGEVDGAQIKVALDMPAIARAGRADAAAAFGETCKAGARGTVWCGFAWPPRV